MTIDIHPTGECPHGERAKCLVCLHDEIGRLRKECEWLAGQLADAKRERDEALRVVRGG